MDAKYMDILALILKITEIGRNLADIRQVILEGRSKEFGGALKLLQQLLTQSAEAREALQEAIDDHAEALDRMGDNLAKTTQILTRQSATLTKMTQKLSEVQDSQEEQKRELDRQIRAHKRQIKSLQTLLSSMQRQHGDEIRQQNTLRQLVADIGRHTEEIGILTRLLMLRHSQPLGESEKRT